MGEQSKAPSDWPTKEMISAGMKRMFDEKRYSAPWDDVIALMFRDMEATAPKVERQALPPMPDLRFHPEYRRGYANCLSDVQKLRESGITPPAPTGGPTP